MFFTSKSGKIKTGKNLLMTLKTYLWLIALASFVALGCFLGILWCFSPQNANPTILILLFLSLFLAMCGFFSLFGFYWRRKRNKTKPAEHFLGTSFREGTLLSLLLIGFLLMQLGGVFYWWTSSIFLIIVVAIEIAFLQQE
ncbi:MAG: hypothetical protein COS30_01835 [Candidatus Portnoybacteria bacterium CG02_land_8_20_14_3_00_45_8]|uniref:Uncharacterized protein n=1 Tax=Candidatus Portnoybacteria bacterium CG02_land_8_20_14_3_00_45_8 TaxID=1974807 RepID=A0A2M7D632_9BACT|nr:MAG: hypothetical protein COS30_01835 [Candidatus Portnoybacteria bacterium CG02_land_8_20_14_3_00_45_8]